eukprot:COSAG03_NODE_2522_length_2677_cov_3.799845_3_plen_240_part_00
MSLSILPLMFAVVRKDTPALVIHLCSRLIKRLNRRSRYNGTFARVDERDGWPVCASVSVSLCLSLSLCLSPSLSLSLSVCLSLCVSLSVCLSLSLSLCVCACVRVHVCVCVRACARVCAWVSVFFSVSFSVCVTYMFREQVLQNEHGRYLFRCGLKGKVNCNTWRLWHEHTWNVDRSLSPFPSSPSALSLSLCSLARSSLPARLSPSHPHRAGRRRQVQLIHQHRRFLSDGRCWLASVR